MNRLRSSSEMAVSPRSESNSFVEKVSSNPWRWTHQILSSAPTLNKEQTSLSRALPSRKGLLRSNVQPNETKRNWDYYFRSRSRPTPCTIHKTWIILALDLSSKRKGSSLWKGFPRRSRIRGNLISWRLSWKRKVCRWYRRGWSHKERKWE